MALECKNGKLYAEDIKTEVNNKVDKEVGKGLSTNDYTTTEAEFIAMLPKHTGAV